MQHILYLESPKSLSQHYRDNLGLQKESEDTETRK